MPLPANLMKFRLLVSNHVGKDYSAKSVKVTDPVTGKEKEDYPVRQWTAPAVILSDVDLQEVFGANKFQKLEGNRGRSATGPHGIHQSTHNASFPGGQVSSGIQATTTGPDGRPLSGHLEDLVAQSLDNAGPTSHQSVEHQKMQAGPATAAEQDTEDNDEDVDSKSKVEQVKSKQAYHAELERMNASDLQTHAKERGIDLKGARNRGDVMDRIKKADLQDEEQ